MAASVTLDLSKGLLGNVESIRTKDPAGFFAWRILESQIVGGGPITEGGMCPQCGVRVRGKFCAACGSAVGPDEGLFARIRSIARDPILGALAFVKTAWLVVQEPRDFFDRYLNRAGPVAAMSFPLSGIWRRLSGSSQKTIAPFQFLFAAVALVALVNGLHSAIWYHFGMGQYAGAGARAFR